MDETHTFEVIIIGGRPAGATLAARLGQGGVRVLLIDRAKFPSLPPVSSPIIYPATMALLDEIGAAERDYAAQTPRIRHVATEAADKYRAIGTIPANHGRDYAYAVDRERFDNTLWRLAASFSTVTAFDEFSATDLIWQGDRVIGIRGKPKGKQVQNYFADVVVGADGRSSMVARRVNAQDYYVHDENPVTYYYAYWCNVESYDDRNEPMLVTHGNLEGFGYLLMDSAEGSTAVTLGGYTKTFDEIPHSDAQDLYIKVLQRAPRVWGRLHDSTQITTVRGLKNVPNFYRQPYGDGWALIGDAAHHKDPLGGQGIYDAVFSARAFAFDYLAYHGGEAWETAMARYKASLEAETLPMYRNTLSGTDNYGDSTPIMQRLGRYAVENSEFVDRMLGVPSRTIKPANVVNPRLVAETIGKGVVRDLHGALTGAPRPSAVPPLPGQETHTASSAPRMGCVAWLLVIPIILLANLLRRKPLRTER